MSTLGAMVVMMVGFSISVLGLFIGIRFLQADPDAYERNRKLLGGFKNVRRGTANGTKLSAARRETHEGYVVTHDGKYRDNKMLSDRSIDNLLKIDG
jgi:hypothetical protein